MKSIAQKPYFFPLAFFLAAFIVRLIYFFEVKNDPLTSIPILDGAYYSKWAKDILAGVPFTNTAYFVEPGYAYILAFFYKIFGVVTTPIIFFQFLLSSGTVALVYMIGERLFRKYDNLMDVETHDRASQNQETQHAASLQQQNGNMPGSINQTTTIAFSQKAGIVAAVLMLLLRPLVFYDGLLLKTSVEIFLITLILYLFTFVETRQCLVSTRRIKIFYFILGLLIGLTAIIKANILYTVPLVFLVILFFVKTPESGASTRKFFNFRNLIVSLIFLLGVIIPILPVTIHNWQASNSFVPINYSGGPNIYIGNWSGADGSLKPPEFISLTPGSEESSWVKMTRAYVGHDPTPAEVSSYWTHQAWQEAMADKSFFFSITAKKITLLFHSMPLDDNYSIEYATDRFLFLGFLWPFWIMAVLGICGMILVVFNLFSTSPAGGRGRSDAVGAGEGEKENSTPLPSSVSRPLERTRATFSRIREKGTIIIILYVIFVSYALTLIASHIAERYRLALAPILAIFAGYFLALIWEKIEILYHMNRDEAQPRLKANPQDVAVPRLYDVRTYKKIIPIALFIIILIYLANRPLGQISKTTPEDTLNNLGSEAMDAGKMDIAETSFLKSIDLAPTMSPAHANLGKLYLEEGRIDDAVSEERKSLLFQPDASTSLLKIALEAQQNNTPVAEIKQQIDELKNQSSDELFDKDYIEAMKLLRVQNYQAAVPMLEKAKDQYPNDGQILVNLSTAYKNVGRLDDAKWNLSLAILADGYNLPARYNMVNVQRKKGENDLALTQLMLINNMVPGYMLSQLQLAELELAKGNVKAALQFYQAFLDNSQNSGQYPDQIQKVTDMVAKLSNLSSGTAPMLPAGSAPAGAVSKPVPAAGIKNPAAQPVPASGTQTPSPNASSPTPTLTPEQLQYIQNNLKNNN